jgi:transposase
MKMEALLLKSQGLQHQEIGKILDICQDTLRGYFEQYITSGIEGLKTLNFYKPQSSLEEHRTSIEEEFRNNPPATLKEAAAKIKELTGIERSTVQVGVFLKKIGIKRLKVSQIPAKADVEKQQAFLEEELQPRLEEAKAGKRQLLFVDASHFVLSAFLGYLWSFTRIFIKSPSGRQRYNVLGAFNPISHTLVTVTNDAYINATTVIELMEILLSIYGSQMLTLVMDNARYQRCALVMEFAHTHGIELLFLPSYSPNLNLIERLWKFVKKKSRYSRYHENFAAFKTAIDDCLLDVGLKYKNEISSLMSLKFQTFRNATL